MKWEMTASSFGKYWHEVWIEHMKVVLVLRIYRRWEERHRRYSPIRIVHSTRHNLWTSCISTSLCEAWLIYDIRRLHTMSMRSSTTLTVDYPPTKFFRRSVKKCLYPQVM